MPKTRQSVHFILGQRTSYVVMFHRANSRVSALLAFKRRGGRDVPGRYECLLDATQESGWPSGQSDHTERPIETLVVVYLV
jgi:hypothetical protein